MGWLLVGDPVRVSVVTALVLRRTVGRCGVGAQGALRQRGVVQHDLHGAADEDSAAPLRHCGIKALPLFAGRADDPSDELLFFRGGLATGWHVEL